MHANRIVAAVVVDDGDDVGAVLLCRRYLLPGHEKTAVADVRDHRAIRMGKFGCDRGRYAGPHAAKRRGNIRVGLLELYIALRPLAEAAGIRRGDGIGRQRRS